MIWGVYDAGSRRDINLYNSATLVFVTGAETSAMTTPAWHPMACSTTCSASGDSIGPVLDVHRPREPEVTLDSGVDGYLGIQFLNEDTGEINFGYAHLTSTSPTVSRRVIVDYADTIRAAPRSRFRETKSAAESP